MKFLDEEQVNRLLETARESDHLYYALIYTAVVTGMRQGELLALKWENIDLEKGIVQVKHNLKRLPGGGLALKAPKTKSSIRAIRLGAKSVAVLQEHKARLSQEEAKHNGLWQETDFVFTSTIGTPIDPSNLIRQFRQLLKQAGLPKIRFHDLRHTAASLMLSNGVEVLAASQRLGHAKPSITLDVYGHLMPSLQDKAAEAMDGLIDRD